MQELEKFVAREQYLFSIGFTTTLTQEAFTLSTAEGRKLIAERINAWSQDIICLGRGSRYQLLRLCAQQLIILDPALAQYMPKEFFK
jgi:hypothetical protein|tara:strand:+ start:7403 stop:7663 length:261 start_codon:yes stop_codon:yes gene_type:complete